MLGPPLVATDAEIDEMVELTTAAVEAATAAAT
jgi:adenosylmethionine-8-amino-7-oxononanoate aminotransferase